MTTQRHWTFILFKAFGDMVIAVSAIKRRTAPSGGEVEVLLGEHLQPLYAALDPQLPTRMLAHGEGGMPAVISVREKGLVRGLRSALMMKKALMGTPLASATELVFDKLDKRERFLAAGTRHSVLPPSDNIYLAYDRFFDERGFGIMARAAAAAAGASGPMRIFPGARLPQKEIPQAVVAKILKVAEAQGIQAELILLEGERPDLAASGLPFTRVERTFPSLIEVVSGAGKVISSDSMPAHLSEYLGRPAFVYAFEPNPYWLPRSSFVGDWSAVFADGGDAPRLIDFLKAPQSAWSASA